MRDVREKILQLIALDFPIEYHKVIADKLRNDFELTQEGLTPDRETAVTEYENMLSARRDALNEKLIAMYASLGFTEEDVDDLLRLAPRVATFAQAQGEIVNEWLQSALGDSPSMGRISHVMAAEWAANNTESDVSESLQRQAEAAK